MDTPRTEEHAHTNRLIDEKSPYLLQHAHNPVDWYPWSDEAFRRAREEDKLIFLSVGYSTCHWCHVMARESFADAAVADALRRHYVAVKVDREERPDIDQIYMEFCQRLTGRGGWPLTVVLTADALPVFAATYLPKDPRPGYDGLIALLERIATQAKENAAELRAAGEQLLASLDAAPGVTEPPPGLEPLVESAASELRRTFDPRHGGFGSAPKFPTPHHLRFLIDRWHVDGHDELLQMAEQTLDAMRRGGLCDHLGGGFHRYATDSSWLLPHFEKMLYDQAGLAEAYLDAWRATGTPEYAATVRATLDYVRAELTDPGGAFHAAEDADTEGEEGLFYLWAKEEIERLLDPEQAQLFCAAYGIRTEGNYRDEASGERTGLNIPHLVASLETVAAQQRMTADELSRRLDEARQRLAEARQQRPRPHRDDKILCAWNGMLVAALARAGRLLQREDYVAAAERAVAFVLARMRRSDGRLLRRWRDGEAAIPAFAEDYAWLIRGLLELYPCRFETSRLQQALELGEELVRLFSPDQGGALFDTGSDAESLVARPRTLYDGATPSANAVALEAFARLYLLTGDPAWRGRAEQIFTHLAALAQQAPQAFTGMLRAAALLSGETRELVIIGEPEGGDTRALLEAAEATSDARLSILLKRPGSRELDAIAPFTAAMTALDGQATAYLCRGQSCRQPTPEPAELRRQLNA